MPADRKINQNNLNENVTQNKNHNKLEFPLCDFNHNSQPEIVCEFHLNFCNI